jgi:hypothetical protein
MNNRTKSFAWGMLTLLLVIAGLVSSIPTFKIYAAQASGVTGVVQSLLWALLTCGSVFFLLALGTSYFARKHRRIGMVKSMDKK